MDTFWQDLRYALRMLVKNPGFTVVAVLTLALGIGANTAIFSVVEGVLLRPMPYDDPSRLAVIWNDYGNAGQSLPAVSPPDFRDYQQRGRLMEFAAAVPTPGAAITVTKSSGDAHPQRFEMAAVTANFFPLFGARPVLGRNFIPEEAAVKGPRVAMLSYRLWQRAYNGDPNLIGKSIHVNGLDLTVVGILPSPFRLLLPPEALVVRDSDVWVPMQLDFDSVARNLTIFTVFGRVKPGTTLAQAQAEMDGIADQLRNEVEVHKESGLRIRVVPLQFDVVKNARPALLTLTGAVGLVLLIACGNVANLLLARASVRDKELAIRAAMGASRSRLIRQIFTESFLLAFLGGLTGLILASFGLDLLTSLRPANLPRLDDIRIDSVVFAYSFGACIVTALLFGMAPALRSARTDVNEGLKEGGRGSGASGNRRIREVLVVAEIAFSLVLLIGAGLLIRSFVAIAHVQPGFSSEHLVTFQVTLPGNRYPKRSDILQFFRQLEPKVAGIAGAQMAGASNKLPLTGSSPQTPYAYDAETSQKWESLSADWYVVTPGYLPAIGARLSSGRFFSASDDADHPRIAIVDETLARRSWPGQNPIGKQLELSTFSIGTGIDRVKAEVVGVIEPLRSHDLTRNVREQIYVPFLQEPWPGLAFVVKTSAAPSALVPQFEQFVGALDPSIAVHDVKPMGDYVAEARAPMQFNLILIGIFGGIALALASVGLYGVTSYSVTQRTHEIGIRMALGAQSRDVLRLVVGQGLALAVVGIAFGMVGAFALRSVLSGLVYSVSARDPLTFAGVALLLAFVALAACYIPARRAMRVDPMVALRYE
ncbi:MAG: ABC transporter permease [Candidatus Acidiferrales bacterium]